MDRITIDDFQDKHKELARIIGIDNLIALSENYGGTPLHIPKKNELLKLKKYKAISKEFDGTNVKILAKKYKVSKTTIYNIVGKRLNESLVKQLEESVNIEDFENEVLQDKHKELARIIGIDNLITLSEYYGSNPFYVPQKNNLLKIKIHRDIYSEFDGTNIKELAKKYEVSETTAYNVVRYKFGQVEGQMSFEDFGI